MKIYYRIKILVNGLFPMKNLNYDGYVQKIEKIDKNVINTENDESIFYMEGNLTNSTFSIEDKKGSWYVYFENKGLFELEIINENNITKEKISDIVLDDAWDRVELLENKLKLLTNLNITLPVFKVRIYNENKKLLASCGMTRNNFNYLHASDYDDSLKKILEERIKLKLSNEELINLKKNNSRIDRALKFYYDSFSPENIGVRFTLLISSLESLFNFNIEGTTIIDEISSYSSKILFLDEKKIKNFKMKIIDYYDIRSYYIHGNDPKLITTKNEMDLREIIRKIILIYIKLSIKYNINDPFEMRRFLDNTNINNLDKETQLFIEYLHKNDLKSIKKMINK